MSRFSEFEKKSLRWNCVYGAAFANYMAQNALEGRGYDDETITRFVEESVALADWSEECFLQLFPDNQSE